MEHFFLTHKSSKRNIGLIQQLQRIQGPRLFNLTKLAVLQVASIVVLPHGSKMNWSRSSKYHIHIPSRMIRKGKEQKGVPPS